MNRRIPFLIALAVLGAVALTVPFWLPKLQRPLPKVVEEDPTLPVQQQPVDEPERPSAQAIQVRVSVYDAETGLSLPGVQVQVGGQQGETDERGLVALGLSSASTHSAAVRAPGYEPWLEQVEVPRRGNPALELAIALEPNTVHGQVLGPELEPLPSAKVVFGDDLVPLDDQARFILRRVKDGDVVSVEHPGYTASQVALDDAPTIQVSLEPVPLVLHVRDAMTGRGIAEADVCTSGDRCQSTDTSGTVTFTGISADTVLLARRQGYDPREATYQGKAELNLELAPRELYGVVRDAESMQPLTNTLLFVNGQLTRVDDQGRYHLPDLTQVYTLFLKSPGHKRLTIPMEAKTTTARYQALAPCLSAEQYPCADILLPRFAVRGIYINFGLLWNRPRMLELIDMVDRSPSLNAIVLDVKGDFGYLAFESTDPLVSSTDAMTEPRLTLEEFLRIAKRKRIYTIARMVIFKDSPLVAARPELGVRHPNGAIFYDREGMAWADPTLEEVWEYNIAITKEVIRMGFDEVQYDYLRYPSDSTSLAVVRALVYSVPSTLESRTGAIKGFVAAAKEAVDETPAFLSLDIFGYALSVEPDHDMRIGQRLKDLAPYGDYVCPMVYPSTFIPGNLGLQSPSDSPYEVVAISLEYGHQRTNTLLRPWLQHYWYGRQELAEQKRAAEEATDVGWCFWSASGSYDEQFFVPPEGIEP